MDDEVKTVETAVPQGQEQASTPPVSTPSPAAPATPTPQPVEDFEKRLNDTLSKKQKEWQASKDRELANVHRTYQERIRQTVGKAAKVLEQHGVKDSAQVEQAFVDDIELDEYRAWKQQAAAQASTFEYGTGIIKDIAQRFEVELDMNDPTLWQASDNWDVFTERVRKAANDKVKLAREAQQAAEAEAKRKAVDSRVAGGSLDTLSVTPAGASITNELDNYSPKDAGKLYEMGAKRIKESARKQR